ncbi:MAG: UDP-N-acetylmuramoyl-tripeptide--D-alanyl-D-alanine ligase, partial [Candidatus Latescibacteria bacterium]|nr:UDP-N-acetylmuramoyl-tripeptide--D-alanyl-D-alanine ligase [Candidatus Latescibacterota bacterium]
MMLAVLGVRYAVHGTKGNFNNHIGVPLSVFGLERHHRCAVFELGMSAPGEIAALADMVKPGIGVVLNAGPAHMEFFPSLEAVADAKMELLEALRPGDSAVVNGDDALLRKCQDKTDADIIRFGVLGDWDIRGEHVAVDDYGRASFTCGGVHFVLAVPGVHNVYNALAAVAVGRLLGIGIGEAASALASFTAPGMRMQMIDCDGVTYINDSYNANPMSMKTAASVLESTAVSSGGRKIAVLGDMLELGGMSESAHREVGALFGGLGVDIMCLVGEWAGAVAEGAHKEGLQQDRIRIFGNSVAAADFVESVRRPGDVILVKGSRGMRMERVIPRNRGN